MSVSDTLLRGTYKACLTRQWETVSGLDWDGGGSSLLGKLPSAQCSGPLSLDCCAGRLMDC